MYRTFNALFGKVGRTALPNVVLQLVKSKCLPALFYGVDVCTVNKSQTASLQYVVDNCFRKIFDVKSTEIVRLCMSEFKWLTMCDMIDIKKTNFLKKNSAYLKIPYAKWLYMCVIRDNVLYSLCRDIVFLCSFPFI